MTPGSAAFDFDNAYTPGWHTGDGAPPYPFYRVRGRLSPLTADTWFLPASGPGGQGYYYFAGGDTSVDARALRRRQTGDLHTLEYSGHHCITAGMVVSTLTFSYHARKPPLLEPWAPPLHALFSDGCVRTPQALRGRAVASALTRVGATCGRRCIAAPGRRCRRRRVELKC